MTLIARNIDSGKFFPGQSAWFFFNVVYKNAGIIECLNSSLNKMEESL